MSQPSEPTPPRGGGLLGRLRGMMDEAPSPPPAPQDGEETIVAPTAPALAEPGPAEAAPTASPPAESPQESVAQEIPTALPNGETGRDPSPAEAAAPAVPQETEQPFAPVVSEEGTAVVEIEEISTAVLEIEETSTALAVEETPVVAETDAEHDVSNEVTELLAEAPSLAEAPAAVVHDCPICASPRHGDESYCLDCGYCFPADAGAAAAVSATAVHSATPMAPLVPRNSTVRLKQRYELVEQIREHRGVARFRAMDYGSGKIPIPVTIVRAPAAVLAVAEAAPVAEVPAAAPAGGTEEEFFPVFDFAMPGETTVPMAVPAVAGWPSIEWEGTMLAMARNPALPTVLDTFEEGGWQYLVEELPTGDSLWDAWDAPDSTATRRFTWLRQIAEGLHALHGAGCMIEGIRPDLICVDSNGQARLKDFADLLPCPVPADISLRGTLYSAPELMSTPDQADARAELYSFGAMVYALNEGRELNELDFERGGPKSFILRYPESHPLLARLITKTFTRDLTWRFPSDESAREDASGFTELIRVGSSRVDLQACKLEYSIVSPK